MANVAGNHDLYWDFALIYQDLKEPLHPAYGHIFEHMTLIESAISWFWTIQF